MKHKKHINHIWLILGAYGVWFAIFSGTEELVHGKYWKAGLSLVLGFLTYIYVENFLNKDK